MKKAMLFVAVLASLSFAHGCPVVKGKYLAGEFTQIKGTVPECGDMYYTYKGFNSSLLSSARSTEMYRITGNLETMTRQLLADMGRGGYTLTHKEKSSTTLDYVLTFKKPGKSIILQILQLESTPYLVAIVLK